MSLLTRTVQISRIKPTISTITRLLNTINISKTTPILSPVILQKITENPWIYRQPDSIKIPTLHKINPFDLPTTSIRLPLIDNVKPIEIEAPSTENVIEKQAARLIVIRRKKMKKHKLRKLRKRMKFEWAKVRQRRELKKEKEFQAVLIKQCKEAESFSAEQYVQQKLDKLHEIIIPKYWKGKRMPEFLIREKMGLPPKK